MRAIRAKGAKMDDFAELERRITAALARIDRAADQLSAPAETGDSALKSALESERAQVAQLTERLRALREGEAAQRLPLQAEVDRLTRLLDVQGLEMQRLKKTVASLRDQIRVMTDAQIAGVASDGAQINKALQVEVDALRALRAAEAAELDEIVAALEPLAALGNGGANHA